MYGLPHCRCYFKFYLPYLSISPTEAVSLYLVNDAVVFLLNESLMDAHIAGLKYNVITSDGGSLLLRFSGYNEKLPLLVQRVCEGLLRLDIDESIFNLAKEEALRDLRNREQDSPYSMVSSLLEEYLLEPYWSIESKLAALEHLTYERFLEQRRTLWGKFSMEAFVAGNATQQQAELLMQQVLDIAGGGRALAAAPGELSARRCVLLPPGSRHVVEKDYADAANTNSAVVAWWQLGDEAVELRVMAYVVEQLIADIVYDVLRTKEQLGYLVSSGEQTFGTAVGLQVVVQSADYSPRHLAERIHACMREAHSKIKRMGRREFEDNIESLLLLKVEKLVTLKQDTSVIWGEITTRHYQFMRLDAELQALRSATVSQESVLRFFEERILLDGPNLRLFEVSVWAARHRLASPPPQRRAGAQPRIDRQIRDVRAFKRRSPLCPAFIADDPTSPFPS